MSRPLHVGVSAVFDPGVTPHARTFLRAMAVGRNHIAGLERVRWHWLDDGADPEQGAWVARQMIERGVDLVIGHFSSDAALAAAPLYQGADIALLTPAATVERLSQYSNVLRLCSSDQQLAADLLLWVRAQSWRHVHVRADASAHGQALAAAIRATASVGGVVLVDSPEHADAEIFAGRLKPSREHWRARREAGYTGPLILTDDAASPHLGLACAHDHNTWVIGFDPGPADCPINQQHQRLYRAAPQTYYRQSMQMLHVVAALAQRSWPDRTSVLEALRTERFAAPLNRIWRVGPAGLVGASLLAKAMR